MSSNKHKVMSFNNNNTIQRFERSEIILHWVNAVPFLILCLTGAMNILSRFEIYFSNSSPFIVAIRLMHKVSAVLWIGGIGFSFFFVGRKLNIANTRDQFNIGLSDIKWMIKAMLSVFSRRIEVPPVGKFNIGQKINALLVILYVVAFAASGALMWIYNTMLFPWYFHAAVFFMTVFSLGGHLYLSFLHPSTRPGLIGIFNGTVPRSYIEHHHGLMIEDAVNAHQETTARSVFPKTERPPQKPESISVPAFHHHGLMNEDTANAPREATAKRVFTRTERPTQETEINDVPAVHHVLRAQDRQKSKYRHMEKVPAGRSRSADAYAKAYAQAYAEAYAHAHADPDDRLVASWHGGPDCSSEESDVQKAWGQTGGTRLSRRQN